MVKHPDFRVLAFWRLWNVAIFAQSPSSLCILKNLFHPQKTPLQMIFTENVTLPPLLDFSARLSRVSLQRWASPLSYLLTMQLRLERVQRTNEQIQWQERMCKLRVIAVCFPWMLYLCLVFIWISVVMNRIQIWERDGKAKSRGAILECHNQGQHLKHFPVLSA